MNTHPARENNEESSLIVDIYARLSKPKKNKYGEVEEETEKGEGNKYNKRTVVSLETQIAEARKIIAANPNWREGMVFQEVYTGPIIHNRTELKRARKRWVDGECDIFLVYDSDRLARGRGLTVLMYEMQENGIAFKSVTEPDLGDSVEDDIMRDLRANFSEMERLKVIKRVNKTLRARTEAGKLNGGNIDPYGYTFDSRHEKLVIVEGEAKIVRSIFQWRYEGLSARKITKRLNQEGTLYRGKLWNERFISSILRHPRYKGEAITWHDRYYFEHKDGRVIRRKNPHAKKVVLPEGTIPAIISSDLFEAVQELLEQGRINSSRRLENPERFLLRGSFIRCAYCQNIMSVRRCVYKREYTPGNKKKYTYYAYKCSRTSHVLDPCPAVTIITTSIDQITWGTVGEELKDLVTIKQALALLEKEKEQVSTIEAFDRAIQQLEEKIATLFEDYEKTPKGQLRSLMHQRLQNLSADLEKMKQEQSLALPQAEADAAWKLEVQEFLKWAEQAKGNYEKASYQEKLRALRVLGITVYVAKEEDKELSRYDIQFSLRHLYERSPGGSSIVDEDVDFATGVEAMLHQLLD